mgnify:CR=1 FL=1
MGRRKEERERVVRESIRDGFEEDLLLEEVGLSRYLDISQLVTICDFLLSTKIHFIYACPGHTQAEKNCANGEEA